MDIRIISNPKRIATPSKEKSEISFKNLGYLLNKIIEKSAN